MQPPVVPMVRDWRPDMSQHNDPRGETSIRADDRYAGFATEDSYVLYDTENETAWIESDIALGLGEMV